MGNIHISFGSQRNYTTISNQFIDSYMPGANGSFVKVYLYLLRSLSDTGRDISISGMADCFENTEKDILRALKYWEKMKLLVISRDSDGEISDIQLVEPDDVSAGELSAVSVKEHCRQNTNTDYTKLAKKPEYESIIPIVETYLSRLLKPQDIENIAFFYNELHFSAELIEHLYDYCVSKGKKSSSYIKTVAVMWADEGIHTKEEAINYSMQYNEIYNEIKHVFSLQRMLGVPEREFADRWHSEYKSPLPLIKEACNRSLLKTGKPDFPYADKILKNWSKKGISTMEQVEKEDTEHKKNSAADNERKFAANHANTTSHAKEKPQNFKQRGYSMEEISLMEKKLLGKKLTTET